MAKINKTEITKRGSNIQYKGTMSKEKLARFKLSGNTETELYHSRNTTLVSRSARMLKTYRIFVHNCNERKLPSSLRQTVHYFLGQLTRADSDNPKDKKGYNSASNSSNVDSMTETAIV